MADETPLRLRELVLDLEPIPEPFDFLAAPGELWVLAGAVDSGRRELIWTVAGLMEPRAGRIELFGADLAQLRPRGRVGVALEQPGLVPAWSVFENLALLVRYRRSVPDGEVERYVVDFVESCRLPRSLLPRLAGDLSPLESCWVGLLRALAVKPQLLLVSAYLPRETLTAGYEARRFFDEVVRPMRMTILVDAGPRSLPITPETRLLVMDRGTLLAARLAGGVGRGGDAGGFGGFGGFGRLWRTRADALAGAFSARRGTRAALSCDGRTAARVTGVSSELSDGRAARRPSGDRGAVLANRFRRAGSGGERVSGAAFSARLADGDRGGG